MDADKIPKETLDELAVEHTALYYPNEGEQALQGFTPEVIQSIMTQTKLGLNLTDVAHSVRLQPSRIRHWYKTNYCNFAYEIDFHRADNKLRLLAPLMQTDPKKVPSPQVSRNAQFLLERKYKDEYGKEVKVEVNHTMVDNISKVVFEAAVRYIKDPETLKLFISDIREGVSVIKPTEGLQPNQRMIT